MASTVLPNGIIVPEKFSRDWYADLYHNWQELDNLLGGGTPKDGTLTIQKNGDTVGTFSANQATDETINISVPDVNDGTLTIQQNGTTVDTFTANSSTDKTVNISVPTKTSDLNNDSGFITGVTWNDVTSKPTFATVATSGSYNDLSNKPTIPTVNNATLTIQKNGTTVKTFTANASSNVTANITVPTKTSDLNNDSGFITGVTWNDVSNKPTFATVATSGAYSDLTGTPTIPTVNDATLTIQQNGTTLDTFTANASVDKTINITTTDDTKIPLAGSNQISGDLIPSTDNTIDIGSSSKKIKSVFANYLNNINLSTLFDISNAGYMTDLNDSTLRVAGKIVACFYNNATLNNPTPGASGFCFTLANRDSTNFGAQVTFSNKGIYARFINDDQYRAWGTIIK